MKKLVQFFKEIHDGIPFAEAFVSAFFSKVADDFYERGYLNGRLQNVVYAWEPIEK